MAGLYFHIPFCSKACTYCDFHFSTNMKNKGNLLAAMEKEISHWAPSWKEPINTVYFGGGTPSVLSVAELGSLLSQAFQCFDISPNAEITLEANPEDLSSNNLQAWQELGINRLSIGVQAFQDEILTWMNRAHSSEMAEEGVLRAHKEGISNLSLDLIYGVPGLSQEQWQKNVTRALALPITHLSCYALTVEERTKLQQQVSKGLVEIPEDTVVLEQFDTLSSIATSKGFEHYEISNLSLPGYASKHNCSYWERVPYLGIGPSAHSYKDGKRWWNVRSNAKYIKQIEDGADFFEEEVLSADDIFNEQIMLGLRRQSGVDIALWQDTKGSPKNILQIPALSELYKEELIYLESSRVKLSQKGRYMADGVAARLFK